MSKLQENDSFGTHRRIYGLIFTIIFLIVFFAGLVITDIDTALYNICQYIEAGYISEKLNIESYNANKEEYTVRILAEVECKVANAVNEENYEEACKSIVEAEEYLKLCTRVIYENKLKSDEIVNAYKNAYDLYCIAKKHIEKLNSVK